MTRVCVHDHSLVFSPLGEIIYCFLNAPGCQHDSTLAQELYHLLLSRTPPGFALAADTAFSASGEMKTRIIKPLSSSQLKRKADDKSVSVKKLACIIKKHRACVSIRQGAEWGMNSIQNCCKRTTPHPPLCPVCTADTNTVALHGRTVHLATLRVSCISVEVPV